ncbi:MAG: hypothetical protein C4K47_08655 [Candidatus Thorarchaeota archaeon]|nr:MAG: hypothetical protein C4K47_08655 [Candidatus Thorarchaeota archaeon]
MIEAARQGWKRHPRIAGQIVLLIFVLFLISFTAPQTVDTTRFSATPISSRVSLCTEGTRVAIVKPCFSATAYSQAFYVFYSRYQSVPAGEYVTTDLNLLNRTVVSTWGFSEMLRLWLTGETAHSLHLVLGETVNVIDEIDVDSGGLFHDGNRLYDVLLLGFTEYVTEREYLYYKQFVASGGTLILMDACNFLAQVTYSNGYLSLTKGHGWEFNGTHAWRSVYHRWPDENMNWIGGNFWRYWTGRHYNGFIANTTNAFSVFLRSQFSENISTSYHGHEENVLENLTGSEVIGYWNFVYSSEYPGKPVAAYIHKYGLGTVIHSGIMASDVIMSDAFIGVFLALSVRLGVAGDVAGWSFPEPLLPSDEPVECVATMHEVYGDTTSGPFSGLAYCDVTFNATSNVLIHCFSCNLRSVSGTLNIQVGEVYHESSSGVLQGRRLNSSCWRLDFSTFLLENANYELIISATWEGIGVPLLFNESMAVLRFAVMNAWWVSIFPWAAPMVAFISTVSFALAYARFGKPRIRLRADE